MVLAYYDNQLHDQISIDGRYDGSEVFAEGGFSKFYRGYDRDFHRAVGIKQILPKFSGQSQLVKMFEREAYITMRLDHPNIVKVFDARKTDEGQYYIVMEYVHGVNLKDLLSVCRKRKTTVPRELALHIIAEVCDALESAHSFMENGERLRIVHKDISPSNIMISFKGHVKVIDFGIAQARIGRGRLDSVPSAGKIAYMSPEQIQDKEHVDHRSDIFSTGVVLFELLTNEKLFTGRNSEEISQKVTAAEFDMQCFDLHHIPPDIQSVIKKAVQTRAAERYTSADNMRRDLSQALQQLGRSDNYERTRRLKNFLQELFPDSKTTDELEFSQRMGEEHTRFIETRSLKEHKHEIEGDAATDFQPPFREKDDDPDRTRIYSEAYDLESSRSRRADEYDSSSFDRKENGEHATFFDSNRESRASQHRDNDPTVIFQNPENDRASVVPRLIFGGIVVALLAVIGMFIHQLVFEKYFGDSASTNGSPSGQDIISPASSDSTGKPPIEISDEENTIPAPPTVLQPRRYRNLRVHAFAATDASRASIGAELHAIMEMNTGRWMVEDEWIWEEGGIRLERQPYRMVVRKAGYLDQWITIGPDEENVSVAMERQPPGAIIVLVDSRTQKRLRTGEIWIKRVVDPKFEYQGKTDSYGSLSLKLPPGSYLVKASSGVQSYRESDPVSMEVSGDGNDTVIVPMRKSR